MPLYNVNYVVIGERYFMKIIKQIIRFIQHDIWRIRRGELPKSKFYLIRQLQTLILTVKGFNEDNCILRASALTFYTLMSIVPVCALAFGIAKGFGYEQVLEHDLVEKFSGHEEVLAKILEFARNLLKHAHGGWIAGVGVGILLWTVLKLLSNIEYAFNEIWGIQKNRTFGRKLGDYMIIMLVAPFFIIMAGSVTVLVTSFLAEFIESPYSAFMGPIVYLTLKLLPYLMIWFVFTFLYMFMPNTSVSLKAGLVSGITAGTLFQLLQWGYVALQIGVTKNNAIYGSFAALPLFLVWLEFSWMIVLFGAEIAYAFQNVDTYDFEPDSKTASIAQQRLVALYIITEICKRFEKGEPPLSMDDISYQMEVPSRLARKVLFELENCGVLSRVEFGEGDKVAFHPAISTEQLSIDFVYHRLENYGSNDIPIRKSKDLDKIRKNLEAIRKSVAKSPGNILLKDI